MSCVHLWSIFSICCFCLVYSKSPLIWFAGDQPCAGVLEMLDSWMHRKYKSIQNYFTHFTLYLKFLALPFSIRLNDCHPPEKILHEFSIQRSAFRKLSSPSAVRKYWLHTCMTLVPSCPTFCPHASISLWATSGEFPT